MKTSLLKVLVLYCALTDIAHVTEKAGQMNDMHRQLAKAAWEIK